MLQLRVNSAIFAGSSKGEKLSQPSQGDNISRPGYYAGGRRDSGAYYLDVSIAVNGRITALNTAYTNQQLTIYHPFSGQPIDVPYKLPQVA